MMGRQLTLLLTAGKRVLGRDGSPHRASSVDDSGCEKELRKSAAEKRRKESESDNNSGTSTEKGMGGRLRFAKSADRQRPSKAALSPTEHPRPLKLRTSTCSVARPVEGPASLEVVPVAAAGSGVPFNTERSGQSSSDSPDRTDVSGRGDVVRRSPLRRRRDAARAAGGCPCAVAVVSREGSHQLLSRSRADTAAVVAIAADRVVLLRPAASSSPDAQQQPTGDRELIPPVALTDDACALGSSESAAFSNLNVTVDETRLIREDGCICGEEERVTIGKHEDLITVRVRSYSKSRKSKSGNTSSCGKLSENSRSSTGDDSHRDKQQMLKLRETDPVANRTVVCSNMVRKPSEIQDVSGPSSIRTSTPTSLSSSLTTCVAMDERNRVISECREYLDLAVEKQNTRDSVSRDNVTIAENKNIFGVGGDDRKAEYLRMRDGRPETKDAMSGVERMVKQINYEEQYLDFPANRRETVTVQDDRTNQKCLVTNLFRRSPDGTIIQGNESNYLQYMKIPLDQLETKDVFRQGDGAKYQPTLNRRETKDSFSQDTEEDYQRLSKIPLNRPEMKDAFSQEQNYQILLKVPLSRPKTKDSWSQGSELNYQQFFKVPLDRPETKDASCQDNRPIHKLVNEQNNQFVGQSVVRTGTQHLPRPFDQNAIQTALTNQTLSCPGNQTISSTSLQSGHQCGISPPSSIGSCSQGRVISPEMRQSKNNIFENKAPRLAVSNRSSSVGTNLSSLPETVGRSSMSLTRGTYLGFPVDIATARDAYTNTSQPASFYSQPRLNPVTKTQQAQAISLTECSDANCADRERIYQDGSTENRQRKDACEQTTPVIQRGQSLSVIKGVRTTSMTSSSRPPSNSSMEGSAGSGSISKPRAATDNGLPNGVRPVSNKLHVDSWTQMAEAGTQQENIHQWQGPVDNKGQMEETQLNTADCDCHASSSEETAATSHASIIPDLEYECDTKQNSFSMKRPLVKKLNIEAAKRMIPMPNFSYVIGTYPTRTTYKSIDDGGGGSGGSQGGGGVGCQLGSTLYDAALLGALAGYSHPKKHTPRVRVIEELQPNNLLRQAGGLARVAPLPVPVASAVPAASVVPFSADGATSPRRCCSSVSITVYNAGDPLDGSDARRIRVFSDGSPVRATIDEATMTYDDATKDRRSVRFSRSTTGGSDVGAQYMGRALAGTSDSRVNVIQAPVPVMYRQRAGGSVSLFGSLVKGPPSPLHSAPVPDAHGVRCACRCGCQCGCKCDYAHKAQSGRRLTRNSSAPSGLVVDAPYRKLSVVESRGVSVSVTAGRPSMVERGVGTWDEDVVAPWEPVSMSVANMGRPSLSPAIGGSIEADGMVEEARCSQFCGMQLKSSGDNSPGYQQQEAIVQEMNFARLTGGGCVTPNGQSDMVVYGETICEGVSTVDRGCSSNIVLPFLLDEGVSLVGGRDARADGGTVMSGVSRQVQGFMQCDGGDKCTSKQGASKTRITIGKEGGERIIIDRTTDDHCVCDDKPRGSTKREKSGKSGKKRELSKHLKDNPRKHPTKNYNFTSDKLASGTSKCELPVAVASTVAVFNFSECPTTFHQHMHSDPNPCPFECVCDSDSDGGTRSTVT